MIDSFSIFTKGGLVLWSKTFCKIKGAPVDSLIKKVLLEERTGENQVTFDPYILKWKLANELELIFVVVYQSILQLLYIDELLDAVKNSFCSSYASEIKQNQLEGFNFDSTFEDIYRQCEENAKEKKRPRQMKSFLDTKKGQEVLQMTKDEKRDKQLKQKKQQEQSESERSENEQQQSQSESENSEADKNSIDEAREQLRKRMSRTGSGRKVAPKVEKVTPPSTKEARQPRVWDGPSETFTKKDSLLFDRSKSNNGDDEAAFNDMKNKFLPSADETYQEEDDDSGLDEEESPRSESQANRSSDNGSRRTGGGLFSKLTSQIKNFTGNKVLTEEDLEPVLKQFRTGLMAKNVATDISQKLVDSVMTSLVGKKTASFTSVAATVKATLEESLERILTPKRSIDILAEALAAKKQGRPYVIVFVGVNGVGKSTNMAKVCYYLKQKGGLSAMIAACDTFRAGAVEQVKQHARCLEVPLFERGYGKDPAAIAKEAVKFARENEINVVLVDTAGRMQDNEPLMRALSKLVNVNNPDLVLFVGEALVGNDAVDQLTKFNQSLADLSTEHQPRLIDGILLTKFDTVDDKVGAALSMVYTTGQPIVFVGTGQKYTNLRKLNVKTVIRALLA